MLEENASWQASKTSKSAARALRPAAVAVVALVIAACATNPATGKKEISLMSEAQEIELGQQMDAEVRREMGVYNDVQLQRYVESVGMRLARASQRPNLPWHFTVVDEPAVNAFALPGGYIYVTRGILPFLDDEAQLAGVLGHEIGHVTARHSAQQYTKATSAGVGLTLLSIFVPEARPLQGLPRPRWAFSFLKHGRDDELQADRLGVDYTAKTGWNPAGVGGNAPHALAAGRGERQPPRRAELAVDASCAGRSRAGGAGGTSKGRHARSGRPAHRTAEDDFLRQSTASSSATARATASSAAISSCTRTCGSRSRFRAGWEIQNSAVQVMAKAPEQDHFMMLQLVPNASGSLDQIAQHDGERGIPAAQRPARADQRTGRVRRHVPRQP